MAGSEEVPPPTHSFTASVELANQKGFFQVSFQLNLSFLDQCHFNKSYGDISKQLSLVASVFRCSILRLIKEHIFLHLICKLLLGVFMVADWCISNQWCF